MQACLPVGLLACISVLDCCFPVLMSTLRRHCPCRPVLSFDASFDEQPHLQLLKEMLGQVFGTPSRHHKAKPFFDHIFSFSMADGCIWMRNYQVGVGVGGWREGWRGDGQSKMQMLGRLLCGSRAHQLSCCMQELLGLQRTSASLWFSGGILPFMDAPCP
jgi:hypothetical protein